MLFTLIANGSGGSVLLAMLLHGGRTPYPGQRYSARRKSTMTSRRLYRSRKQRLIAGVAGGMAERFGLPVILVRLVWLLLLLPGGLPGVVPYVICWLVIPSE